MVIVEYYGVGPADQVAAGTVMHVEAGGHEIAIYNLGGEFVATDDRCTHLRARLSDGYLEGAVIECQLHFGKFDVRSGRPLSAPCTTALNTYPVKVVDGMLLVGIARLP